ncbi:uncharacterized protein A1O9_00343 [Exophiala aquamarina CBS 119918]|uniref:Major facilitator superfamily (MFS) profile domain-containing protein n=1 Tax=Exophiala aquamarina CBS 119918 TaxID=1182545 RepID=A0A072PR81_9EURO|nr:uncharacterized protein A1O9_00343 [Exophiala aquamarina CBS 119918]KEF62371.1 hypothetical protein A1O9_00343 [Exophiala aquamarina CBS 119918]
MASQASTGLIVVESSVTVEEVARDQSASNRHALFGDASQLYSATVSASSQFARNLFSTTTLHNSNPDLSETPARNKRWIAIALLLALINLICTIADTMMSVMLPAIMVDLDIEGFTWALAGPAVGSAATVLIAGQLYGVYRFKYVYLLFSILILTGILLSAITPSMILLFNARIVLGIGIAGQHLGVMIFLDHDGTFADKTRRDFFISVSAGIGLILGPICGGASAHRDKGWTAVFFVAFVMLLLLIVALMYVLPSQIGLPPLTRDWSSPDTLRSRFSRILRIDIIGCALSSIGILQFLITFNLAGTRISWSDMYVYIPFTISGLAICMFIVQQAIKFCTHPGLRVFPATYLRHFKTTILFGLTFLISGILNTTLPYVALYQMLTRPEPSALGTGTFFLCSFGGPHLIPTILVPVYIGSGLVTSYPLLPSYTLWSTVTSTFLMAGTILLFVNAPSFFPGQEGLPSILIQFALACIGWWCAVTLPMAHQIIDLLQPRNSGNEGVQHPYHNRCFILFASYLGSAIALTSTGSIFMHLGPRWTLQLLQDQLKDPFIHDAVLNPTREDSLIALLGYAFIRSGTSAELLHATIAAIRNTFSWSFVVILGFATLAFILSVIMLMYKIWKGYFELEDGVGAGVPDAWRLTAVASQSGGTETRRGNSMELEDRDTNQSTAVGNTERGDSYSSTNEDDRIEAVDSDRGISPTNITDKDEDQGDTTERARVETDMIGNHSTGEVDIERGRTDVATVLRGRALTRSGPAHGLRLANEMSGNVIWNPQFTWR